MVSIWLTEIKRSDKSGAMMRHEKNRPRGARPIFFKYPGSDRERLLAILLYPGGAQAGEAVLVDRELPGEEFIHGQRVAAAGLLEREESAANRSDDLGFTANDPPFGSGRRQVRDRKRAAVGPDDVFHPRAMGFCHGVLTNS